MNTFRVNINDQYRKLRIEYEDAKKSGKCDAELKRIEHEIDSMKEFLNRR